MSFPSSAVVIDENPESVVPIKTAQPSESAVPTKAPKSRKRGLERAPGRFAFFGNLNIMLCSTSDHANFISRVMAIETGSDADVQVSFTMGSRQAALRNASPPNIVAIHGFDSMLTSESVYSHIIT